MANIVDIDYLASSSAHTYKVYKPSRRKSTKSDQIISNMCGNDAYEHYISKLDETYAQNEKSIFYDLAEQLTEYVIRVNGIYTKGHVTSFQNIQCAIVTMSVNINGLDGLYELLFEQIKDYISMRLILNSDRVKCITDFVKILQENLIQYLDLADVEIPYCLYGLTADFYHNNLNNKLPLVVVFEDFDCFNINLLSDMMMLIHENLEKMPLLLICCQSTDILPLNFRLPAKATNHLSVEHFAFQSTHNFFTQLIEDICWDSSFKLGPKTISHLTDVYKLWDTSLSGAFRRVKLCVFEHFYNKRYTKLCCPTSKLNDVISKLTEEDLISIRNLPSLKGEKLPEDDKAFAATLKKNMVGFCEYIHGIQHELKVYHRLKELLFPGESFTFLMSTWVTFLKAPRLSETVDFFIVCDQVNRLLEYQIVEIMDQLSKFSETEYSDIYKALREHYKSFIDKVKEEPVGFPFLKENKPQIHDPQKRTRASHGISSPRKTTTIDRKNLVNSLQQAGKKGAEKLEKWKEEFLDILKEALDQISSPLYLPYNEIFFFDDIDKVKQFSMPTVRRDILDALSSPEKILNCKCCKGIGPNSPDISITFTIYCDSLRIINLKRCFDIFTQLIVTQPETTRVSPRKKVKKESQKVNEKQALTRFIISIGDLEYLGFLRAHPRKVDHIERLVWPVNVHKGDTENNSEDEKMSQISQISQNLTAITI